MRTEYKEKKKKKREIEYQLHSFKLQNSIIDKQISILQSREQYRMTLLSIHHIDQRNGRKIILFPKHGNCHVNVRNEFINPLEFLFLVINKQQRREKKNTLMEFYIHEFHNIFPEFKLDNSILISVIRRNLQYNKNERIQNTSNLLTFHCRTVAGKAESG